MAERRARRVSRAGTEDRDMAGNEISGFVLSGNSPECCGGGANKSHATVRVIQFQSREE